MFLALVWKYSLRGSCRKQADLYHHSLNCVVQGSEFIYCEFASKKLSHHCDDKWHLRMLTGDIVFLCTHNQRLYFSYSKSLPCWYNQGQGLGKRFVINFESVEKKEKCNYFDFSVKSDAGSYFHKYILIFKFLFRQIDNVDGWFNFLQCLI